MFFLPLVTSPQKRFPRWSLSLCLGPGGAWGAAGVDVWSTQVPSHGPSPLSGGIIAMEA